VGIEEDTALLVRDLRHAEVMGRGPVLMIDGRGGKDTLHIDLLRSGERFDLERRKRVR
jgi:cyanophycinase-like exopeptidase